MAPVGWRKRLDGGMASYGRSVASRPRTTLAALALAQLAAIGVWMAVHSGTPVPLETDIAKLWIESGGRVEEEVAYVDAHETKGFKKSTSLILFEGKTSGANVLTSEALYDHLYVARAVQELSVPYTLADGTPVTFSLSGRLGSTLSIYSLCDFVPLPKDMLGPGLAPIAASSTPCNRATALDCFVEGDFDFLLGDTVSTLHAAVPDTKTLFGLAGYRNRDLTTFAPLPSLAGKTPEQMANLTRNGCRGYVTNLMDWDMYKMFGGHKFDAETGELVGAEVILYAILMGSPSQLARKFAAQNISEADLEDLQTQLALKLEALIEQIDQSGVLNATRVTVWAQGSTDRLMDEFAEGSAPLILAGYALMAVFVMVSQFRPGSPESTVLVGLVGLLAVFAGNIFALALVVLGGAKLNATILQVLPFLALGLGVDDLFVLLSLYKEVVRSKRFGPRGADVVAEVLRRGGISVALTSACNAAAFAMGTVIPLPAVQVFCVAAAVAVAVNFVTLIVAVPALLALRAQRSHKVAQGPVTDGAATDGAAAQPLDEATNKTPPQGFIRDVYAPLLSKLPVRVAGVIAFAALTGVCAYMITLVPLGLRLSEVVPSDTQLFRAIELAETKASLSSADVATGALEYGDPVVQAALLTLMSDLGSTFSFVINSRAKWLEFVLRANVGPGNFTPAVSSSEFTRLYLTNYTNPDRLEYLDAYEADMPLFGYDATGALLLAFMPFEIVGLTTTDETVAALREIREFLEARCGPDKVIKHCFPTGALFQFWEQYVALEGSFFTAVGLSVGAIFLCCAALLAEPITALFVSVFSLAVVVHIYGMLYLAGLTFSAIPAVSLIMSIGIAVEFSAHLCSHFATAHGTRSERMREALASMALPIAEGGFSSLLGFLCLALSPFAFIQKYYFLIYLLVVATGLVNGLFFLPLFLGMVGPMSTGGGAK